MSPPRSTAVLAAVVLPLFAFASIATACTGDRAGPSGAGGTGTAAATSTSIPAVPTSPPPVCGAGTGLATGTATIQSSDIQRSYLVDVPTDLDPAAPVPIIFNFHGSGSSKGEQAGYSQLPARAVARGYVVITPDGTNRPREWSLGGDLDPTLVTDLLAQLSAKICVDTRRIYAAGISDGSAFSAILTCTAPYRIAAAGLVAAEVPPACPEGTRRSVMAFHGTKDPVVPIGGGPVATESKLVAPGALAALTGWADHNGCDPAATEEQVTPHVLRRSWNGCADGTEVVYHEIDGGGHTWPGAIDVSKLGMTGLGAVTDEISATDLLLDFFDRHQL